MCAADLLYADIDGRMFSARTGTKGSNQKKKKNKRSFEFKCHKSRAEPFFLLFIVKKKETHKVIRRQRKRSDKDI
jgi:hypothetical protein